MMKNTENLKKSINSVLRKLSDEDLEKSKDKKKSKSAKEMVDEEKDKRGKRLKKTLEEDTVEKFDLKKSSDKISRISSILAKADAPYDPKKPYPGEEAHALKPETEQPKPFRLDQIKPAHYSDSPNLKTFRKLADTMGDKVYDNFAYDPKTDQISSVSKQGKDLTSAAVKVYGNKSPALPKAAVKPKLPDNDGFVEIESDLLKQSIQKTTDKLRKTSYNKKIKAKIQAIKDSQIKPESEGDMENRVRARYIKPSKPKEKLDKDWSLDGMVEGAREMIGRPASGGMAEGDSTAGDTSNDNPRGNL